MKKLFDLRSDNVHALWREPGCRLEDEKNRRAMQSTLGMKGGASMADAAAPSEGALVFDRSRLDVVTGDGKSLCVDFIVAPDGALVAFRIRQEGTDNGKWHGAYE